jgi:hypothetical protein
VVTPAGGGNYFVHVEVRNAGPAAMAADQNRPVMVRVADRYESYPVLLQVSTPGWTCQWVYCQTTGPVPAGTTVVLDAVVDAGWDQPRDPVVVEVSGGATAESDLGNNRREAPLEP